MICQKNFLKDTTDSEISLPVARGDVTMSILKMKLEISNREQSYFR